MSITVITAFIISQSEEYKLLFTVCRFRQPKMVSQTWSRGTAFLRDDEAETTVSWSIVRAWLVTSIQR